jgi:hypothetical protein
LVSDFATARRGGERVALRRAGEYGIIGATATMSSSMRTVIILAAGLLIFAGMFLYSRLFVQHYPHATMWVTWGFVAAWLAATVFNLWVGVSHAGYSVREELPILLLLFGVPAAVALLVRWKFA